MIGKNYQLAVGNKQQAVSGLKPTAYGFSYLPRVLYLLLLYSRFPIDYILVIFMVSTLFLLGLCPNTLLKNGDESYDVSLVHFCSEY